MADTERKPLFERLGQGLREGMAHAQGQVKLKTVEVPEAPPEIDPGTLSALRRQSHMSQAMFARVLSVSTKTLQSWEQGTRHPSSANLRLIQLFSQYPELICRSVGVPEVSLDGVDIQQRQGKRKIVLLKKPKTKA